MAGTRRQELKQKPQMNAAYGLPPHGLLKSAILFNPRRERRGILRPLLGKKMLYRLAKETI